VETKKKFVRLSVQTRDFRLEGILEVPSNSYRGRLLDYLNGGAEFLALTDVSLWGRGEDVTAEPATCDVLLLRRSAIEFAIPLHDPTVR
jgi:Family of unknown function (DUF6812)